MVSKDSKVIGTAYDIRKFRDDKIHLLKRITLEEREIQTLPGVLGVA